MDYSKKETDEFGTTTFVKRAVSKRVSAQVFIPNKDMTRITTLFSKIRATPCLWIVTDVDEHESFNTLGYYRDFGLSIEYLNHSVCSVEIEGLT